MNVVAALVQASIVDAAVARFRAMYAGGWRPTLVVGGAYVATMGNYGRLEGCPVALDELTRLYPTPGSDWCEVCGQEFDHYDLIEVFDGERAWLGCSNCFDSTRGAG